MKKFLLVFLISVSSVCLADGCDDLIVNFTNKSTNDVRLIYINDFYDSSYEIICNKDQCSPEVVFVKPLESIILPKLINSGSHKGVGSKLFFKINNNEFSSISITRSFSKSIFGREVTGKTSVGIIKQSDHYALVYNILSNGNCQKGEPSRVEVTLSDNPNNPSVEAYAYPDL